MHKDPQPPNQAVSANNAIAAVDDAARLAALSLDATFLRTVIEETGRAFFVIEPATRALRYISPAFEQIWQLPRSYFYEDGDRWFATIHDDDKDRCFRATVERLQHPERKHSPFDYRIFRPNGEQRWIRGNVFRCFHGESDESLLCGIAEDVTDLKRSEQSHDATQAELENTVRIRTAELTTVNEALRAKESFLEKMLNVQEWERKLVAFEIHDGAIQNVVAARMHLDSVAASKLTQAQQKKLASSAELLRAAVDESRRVINGMRPQTLDVLGLRAAVDELLSRLESDGLRIELHYELSGARLSPMIETTIYRLIQESLTNVQRHAAVHTAQVHLQLDADRVILRVADDGRGFDPTAPEKGGFGLRGLRERAKAIGGEVTIDAAPNCGVVVTARLPLLDPLEAAKSERDFAAAALQLHRKRLEQIINKTSAVIFVKDHEGRYELVNREYERMFRMTAAQIIGRTDFDFMPQAVAEAVTENDRAAARSPTPITFEETVPEEGVMRDFVTIKFTLPGEPGKPPSICGIATDITEQKRQFRRLQEARNQFQAFMDHSPILAWIKDAEFRYVFMNRRMLEIFKLEPGAALGKTDFELFPERWAAPVHEHDAEVLRTGETKRYREYCPVGSSEPLPWEACKFRLQTGDGKHLIAGVALDVSGKLTVDQYGLPTQ